MIQPHVLSLQTSPPFLYPSNFHHKLPQASLTSASSSQTAPIASTVNFKKIPPHQSSSQNLLTKHWNTKISHQLQMGEHLNSISLYHQMLEDNVPADSATFALVLKACSSAAQLRTLRLIHNDILHSQFNTKPSVVAALFSAYLKCGRGDLGCQMIERMSLRDVVLWTMIIRMIYQSGHLDYAMWIFKKMVEVGVVPDEMALVTAMKLITACGCVGHGMEVHAYLIRKGLNCNEIVVGSLVNMYSKLGKMVLANQTFDAASTKNVKTWTALISGLNRAGDAIGATTLLGRMMNLGIEPTDKTMSCVLCAVSQLGSLPLGNQIHAQVIKRQFTTCTFVMSGLIDMYTKCADHVYFSQLLFSEMGFKDVVSWTAMISAYGKVGNGHAALRTYHNMLDAGVCPDSVTFTSVLSACSSSGMLQEGLRCFDSMIRDHKIRPREEHYAVLTDLIAKDGRLEEAYQLIESMDLRGDGEVWEALLRACRVHGNVSLGECASRRLIDIKPDCSSSCIILSDIYSANGRWEDAAAMLRQRLKK